MHQTVKPGMRWTWAVWLLPLMMAVLVWLIPVGERTPEAMAASPAWSFAVIGDSGSGLAGQKAVAAEMVRQYQQKPYDLVLMLGDNIYPDGNVKQYGQQRFLAPYQPLLDKGVNFYPALGNHDVLGGFKQDVIRFFKMPGAYYDFRRGDVHFFAIDTNAFDRKQQQWLTHRLKTSHSRWKIVYGHHPVYSSGMHGNSAALIRDLKPLLEIYRVDLYLSGHDHNYERFATKNGVLYLVSGGAGASLRQFGKPVAGSQVRKSLYHFLRFEAHENTLEFKVLDTQGVTVDAGKLLKPPTTVPIVERKPAA